MARVELRNVWKKFGPVEVIKGVDLDIEDGEFIVLVGPSGCGKSTLLNLVAGLETLTSGDIRIGEDVVNDVPPKDRNIAMVFQSYALYPTKSVRDNITFGMQTRRIAHDMQERALADVSQLLHIDQLLERKPGQLSGGQRQRVAMGRALVRNPDVFLFDEPLSNLDAKLRIEMRTEVKKLHLRLGKTIIYVTHDPDRGDDARIPHRGHGQRSHPPVRHARGNLRESRRSLRRRLHGVTFDEHRSRPGDERRPNLRRGER